MRREIYPHQLRIPFVILVIGMRHYEDNATPIWRDVWIGHARDLGVMLNPKSLRAGNPNGDQQETYLRSHVSGQHLT
jgi:hypothetical protein